MRAESNVYVYFQNQDIVGWGFKGIEEVNKERVLEVLQDFKFAGDLVAFYQFFVYKFSGYCAFGFFLIIFFNDREFVFGKQVEKMILEDFECVTEKRL